MEELGVFLRTAQQQRDTMIICRLAPSFAVRVTDAQLDAAFTYALPLVQQRTWQVYRSRGGMAELRCRLAYRDGVRMLDRTLAVPSSARLIAEEAMRLFPDGRSRFCWLHAIVSHAVSYENTAPGRCGYDHLVRASCVLETGRANCQGFADLLYLLSGLAGIQTDFQCGRRGKGLHLWNLVHLDGEWYASDASRGSRALRDSGIPEMTGYCLMTEPQCRRIEYHWEAWAASQTICKETVASLPQCIQEISASACEFLDNFVRNSENPPFTFADVMI